jgi:hypothetical protein
MASHNKTNMFLITIKQRLPIYRCTHRKGGASRSNVDVHTPLIREPRDRGINSGCVYCWKPNRPRKK